MPQPRVLALAVEVVSETPRARCVPAWLGFLKPLLGLLSAAACTSLHEDLGRDFLTPTPDWLVEPKALGLTADAFELPVDGGTLTGWFVRAEQAAGRTVLLFHDGVDNISALHPYYGFLVAAGLNVCVFDYRGFGRSQGKPSLRATVNDLPTLLDWLRARPDVDAGKIAFYGLSFGGVFALHAAAHHAGCTALVVENVPSPRDAVRARIEARGQVAGTLAAGFAEFTGLPEDFEPADNAARLDIPSLFVAGADVQREQLRATLRAFFDMGGAKQLWILPDTAAAPHSLLTHDGEYQRTVATFLRTALDGAPEQVAVAWRRVGASPSGSATFEISLARRDAAPGAAAGTAAEPWAVQVCALDADGAPTFAKTWLDGSSGSVRLELATEPGAVSAVRIGDAERTPVGAFARSGTPLSRAGAWYEQHADAFALVQKAQPAIADVKTVAALVRARDEQEALPPLLESELAAVFASLGHALANSPDAEDRAAATAWLRRAIAAQPAQPERHYWPGRVTTRGFPQRAAVLAAQTTLARLEGK